MHRNLFIAASICLVLYSCRDEYTICNESKYAIANGTLLKRTAMGDSAIKSPAFTITDLATNTVIVNQAPNFSILNLVLNTAVDSASFSLKFSPASATDTLTIKYATAQEFLSVECGTIDVFNISSIMFTKHSLDTVKLVDPAVRNRNATNVKLYY